ncbi:MAG: 7TM diverse intracellular signaling domain-containing protein [Spirosomataceae bacterium]
MKAFRIIVLLLIHHLVLAQNGPVFVLNDDFESSNLLGFVSRYDSDKQDSIQKIFSSKDFKLSPQVPSFNADFQYHWLKFKLNFTQNKQLVIEYQQIFIDEISFYLLENDTLIQKSTSSWKLNFSDKPVPSRYHAFAFNVKKGKSYTVFLRCHNSQIKYSNRAFLKVFDSKIYKKEADFYLLQICLSVGSLLFVTILSLGFFGYSRKRVYIFYALYIVSISLYILVVNGVVNQFFDVNNSFLSQPEFGSILVVLNLAFHCLYVFEFFKIKHKFFLWSYGIFLFINILQTLLFAFNPQNYIPFSFIYLYFAILIISTLIVNFKLNKKAVYLYLAASGPAFLTFIFVILGAIGLTKINTFFYYYAHIPLTLEGIGLGLALLYLFNDERKKIEIELERNRVETTQKILLAQEEERQRLALDLHDDLGGSLSVLNRELDDFNQKNAQILTKSVNLTQKIVSDLRTISHHLMPSSFEEKGLVKVVQESIEMANRQSKVYFVFVSNGAERRLPLETEINIYRIIKELINNVLKHSEAKQSVVQMIYFDDFLYVSVEDDGKGFDFSSQQSWGIGLNNINLRTQYLKAKITTESSSVGTLISLEIPYNAYENQNSAG